MPPAKKKAPTKRTTTKKKAEPASEPTAAPRLQVARMPESQAAPEPEQTDDQTEDFTVRYTDADGAQGPGSRAFLLTSPLTGPEIDAALAARTGIQPPLGIVILQDPATAAPDHALVMWVISAGPSDEDIEAVLTELGPEAPS